MESESPKPTQEGAISINQSAISRLRNFSRRRMSLVAVLVLGALLLSVVSFALGFSAGVHKTRFSTRFGENYERNFMKSGQKELKEKTLRKMDGKLLRSGHGVGGQILSVHENSIILQNVEGQESNVTLTEATTIMRGGDRVMASDLRVGDKLVVLGKPGDDGTILADLVRVFDRQTEGVSPLRKLFR